MFPLVLQISPLMADPAADYERGLKAFRQDDLIGAMNSLEAAAKTGHADAQVLLGYILDKAEDNKAAVQWYRRAAENGNAVGAYRLASMYAAGDGFPRDYEEALRWYRQSAAADYGPALEVLAGAYMEGRLGLPADRQKGLELLRQAAAKGYEPARLRLEAQNNKP